jgi:hypothetical protein
MGRRQCTEEGCCKWVQGGGTPHCRAHGGGKRCQEEGCPNGAEGDTNFCKAHGGGRRCQHEGCITAAQGGKQRCVVHGGGRRCQEEGCCKLAQDGKHCKGHGGGKRCQTVDCFKYARHRTLYRARRRQALPAPGLPQGCCYTRNAPLLAGASAASTRAAPSQSFELPAVCTAGFVSSASSPTMRRTMHRNSVARPRRPKPRVSWKIWYEDSTGGGGQPTG